MEPTQLANLLLSWDQKKQAELAAYTPDKQLNHHRLMTFAMTGQWDDDAETKEEEEMREACQPLCKTFCKYHQNRDVIFNIDPHGQTVLPLAGFLSLLQDSKAKPWSALAFHAFHWAGGRSEELQENAWAEFQFFFSQHGQALLELAEKDSEVQEQEQAEGENSKGMEQGRGTEDEERDGDDGKKDTAPNCLHPSNYTASKLSQAEKRKLQLEQRERMLKEAQESEKERRRRVKEEKDKEKEGAYGVFQPTATIGKLHQLSADVEDEKEVPRTRAEVMEEVLRQKAAEEAQKREKVLEMRKKGQNRSQNNDDWVKKMGEKSKKGKQGEEIDESLNKGEEGQGEGLDNENGNGNGNGNGDTNGNANGDGTGIHGKWREVEGDEDGNKLEEDAEEQRRKRGFGEGSEGVNGQSHLDPTSGGPQTAKAKRRQQAEDLQKAKALLTAREAEESRIAELERAKVKKKAKDDAQLERTKKERLRKESTAKAKALREAQEAEKRRVALRNRWRRAAELALIQSGWKLSAENSEFSGRVLEETFILGGFMKGSNGRINVTQAGECPYGTLEKSLLPAGVTKAVDGKGLIALGSTFKGLGCLASDNVNVHNEATFSQSCSSLMHKTWDSNCGGIGTSRQKSPLPPTRGNIKIPSTQKIIGSRVDSLKEVHARIPISKSLDNRHSFSHLPPLTTSGDDRDCTSIKSLDLGVRVASLIDGSIPEIIKKVATSLHREASTSNNRKERPIDVHHYVSQRVTALVLEDLFGDMSELRKQLNKDGSAVNPVGFLAALKESKQMLGFRRDVLMSHQILWGTEEYLTEVLQSVQNEVKKQLTRYMKLVIQYMEEHLDGVPNLIHVNPDLDRSRENSVNSTADKKASIVHLGFGGLPNLRLPKPVKVYSPSLGRRGSTSTDASPRWFNSPVSGTYKASIFGARMMPF